MAREAMDVCLRVLKESNKSRFDSYSVRKSALIISHITFRVVACTVFSTTFLEIAVYAYSCRICHLLSHVLPENSTPGKLTLK